MNEHNLKVFAQQNIDDSTAQSHLNNVMGVPSQESQSPTPLGLELPSKHMQFEQKKKFGQMLDMQMFDRENNYIFFEPKPFDNFDDSTLEGCMKQFVKMESLFQKDNLYFCEMCTEDKYGKSKR